MRSNAAEMCFHYVWTAMSVISFSGLSGVSKGEVKDVDLKAEPASSGVQFLEWATTETRTKHLRTAHLSPQGRLRIWTYAMIYMCLHVGRYKSNV